jgi:uncharacterized repeat protein (TIGR04042 family)
MPEVYMHIEWPDESTDRVYSPSSVIRDFFEEGETLSVPEFETRVVEALNRARDRVREVYGMECTSARQELRRLRTATEQADEEGTVTVLQL